MSLELRVSKKDAAKARLAFVGNALGFIPGALFGLGVGSALHPFFFKDESQSVQQYSLAVRTITSLMVPSMITIGDRILNKRPISQAFYYMPGFTAGFYVGLSYSHHLSNYFRYIYA